ncbi:hypothetical protein PQO03_03345 [Lentisphaera profundi]|uniref:Uncharacterized protein n=1 Tax=Lentisphaera profundi TaxID=1658616 RepID=A0ABY7VS09_9BACT|nr:hypothetical protein [Lentisphaera profundi]WDE96995.1 hypothetical protein PQO03_03345 [Lentisphaera profundi]
MPNVYVRPSLNPTNITPKTKQTKGPFAYLHLSRTMNAQNFAIKERQSMQKKTNALLDSVVLSDIEEQQIDKLLKESLSLKYCSQCSEELAANCCPYCE